MRSGPRRVRLGSVLVAAALAAGQEPRVPLTPTFELPVSARGVVPREPVGHAHVLRIAADGSVHTEGRCLVPVPGATESVRAAHAALVEWMAPIAERMPVEPGTEARSGGPLRAGPLHVRADRDAPFARVQLVLDACARPQVRLARLALAVRRNEEAAPEAWLPLQLPRCDLPGCVGIGHAPDPGIYIGPVSVAEVTLRVLPDPDRSERRLEYQIGPRRTQDREAFAARARALRTEDPERRWLLGAERDVRWDEVLSVLDILTEFDIEPAIERPAGLPY